MNIQKINKQTNTGSVCAFLRLYNLFIVFASAERTAPGQCTGIQHRDSATCEDCLVLRAEFTVCTICAPRFGEWCDWDSDNKGYTDKRATVIASNKAY